MCFMGRLWLVFGVLKPLKNPLWFMVYGSDPLYHKRLASTSQSVRAHSGRRCAGGVRNSSTTIIVRTIRDQSCRKQRLTIRQRVSDNRHLGRAPCSTTWQRNVRIRWEPAGAEKRRENLHEMERVRQYAGERHGKEKLNGLGRVAEDPGGSPATNDRARRCLHWSTTPI